MYSQGILPRQDVQQRQRQQHSIRRNLNSSYSGFRSTFSTRHHPGTVATTVAEDRNQLLLEAELRLAQRDKRWFQSALAEANHKLEESQRDIQRLLVCESQLKDMETKFKSAEAEKTKVLDMVRKGVTEAEKAIEDERSRFHERTKEYESKLNEALELGAEAKAEAKDLEEQLCAAREEIRSAEKRVDSEADEKIQILENSVGRLEEQLRVANDRIKFMMKENEGKEKRIGELQSEQDDLKRQLKEERESFQIKLQNTLKDQREKHDKIVNMLRRDIEAASLRKHDKIKEEVKKLPLLTDVLESSTNKNPVVLEKKKVSSASVIVLDELNKKLSFLKDRNLSSQYHRRISSSSSSSSSSSEMFRHEKKNNSNNTKQVVSEATREIPRYMKPKRVEKQQSPPLDVVVKKENWQSNLRDRNGDAIVIAKKKSNLRKPRKMSNVLSAQRQNRIRSSRQKETQKEFVDPQKKALVRLRERRVRNRSKHVSPKLSKQEMIRQRREQEKKRHAKERMRLRRNEMRKQKKHLMQEQADIQMKSILSETRVRSQTLNEQEDEEKTSRLKPPPPPSALPVDSPVRSIDKENSGCKFDQEEERDQQQHSSDVETFLRESEESNRRVKMLRERREQLRGRLLRHR